jgi:hypothetical protein
MALEDIVWGLCAELSAPPAGPTADKIRTALAQAAAIERAACAELARSMASKGWGTAPLNALAGEIEARGAQ